MKIKKNNYQKILADIKTIWNSYDPIVQDQAKQYPRPLTVLNTLWMNAYNDRHYDNLHPRYANGVKRVLEYQPDIYDLYPDNSNDVTMSTALIKIGHELHIIAG